MKRTKAERRSKTLKPCYSSIEGKGKDLPA